MSRSKWISLAQVRAGLVPVSAWWYYLPEDWLLPTFDRILDVVYGSPRPDVDL